TNCRSAVAYPGGGHQANSASPFLATGAVARGQASIPGQTNGPFPSCKRGQIRLGSPEEPPVPPPVEGRRPIVNRRSHQMAKFRNIKRLRGAGRDSDYSKGFVHGAWLGGAGVLLGLGGMLSVAMAYGLGGAPRQAPRTSKAAAIAQAPLAGPIPVAQAPAAAPAAVPPAAVPVAMAA